MTSLDATASAPVTIVGAGLAGLACARALGDSGIHAHVVDRGKRVGGRVAARTLAGRQVDIGASYLTAREGSGFAGVVDDWVTRGLAREWTRTFHVAEGRGLNGESTGPVRYAAPGGLRSLVVDLAQGVDVRPATTVESVEPGRVDSALAAEVVLAMPDPQARRLIEDAAPLGAALEKEAGWEPVIAVVLGWSTRAWDADLHGVFVNADPKISFIADDGDRRGDDAPVLVVHTTAGFARRHLAHPDGAIPDVVHAVRQTLGIRIDPAWTFAHRWSFARPAAGRHQPYARAGGRAVCGDAWGSEPAARTAWESGHALGLAIAADR
ncbi:NAD(P)-binding protein [Microbacterium sp. LRZ72]|uniref:NAD(P)/FAD-dependent oxidoreductase n=1 Tax=Microbacterium sp. LRZ72 TaxID=2942481 RepID=UPI0029A2A952|nr:NAD(P)-binding protein [Microbacterium sp. LRZ72]MDX2375903.1 NAD(P)-binding protein [Microbacterium sp. LRZ72]